MVTFLCLIRKKTSLLQKVSHYSLKIPSFCCSIVIARTFSCSTKDMMTCVLFPSNSFLYSLNHNVQCDHQKLASNLKRLTVLERVINDKIIVLWLHACFLPRFNLNLDPHSTPPISIYPRPQVAGDVNILCSCSGKMQSEKFLFNPSFFSSSLIYGTLHISLHIISCKKLKENPHRQYIYWLDRRRFLTVASILI